LSQATQPDKIGIHGVPEQYQASHLELPFSYVSETRQVFVFVENGTVAWPGNIDIDPETLYALRILCEYSVRNGSVTG
jgi:hypothetical protein